MVVPKYNEIYNDVLYVLSDGKEHNHHDLANTFFFYSLSNQSGTEHNHHDLANTIADNINLSKEDKLETISLESCYIKAVFSGLEPI